MNRDIVILLLGVGIILSIGIGVINLTTSNEEKNKIEAQKILDFRNEEHSCMALGKLYLTYYSIKYNSSINLKWFWEVEDTLITTKCIDKDILRNLEFIETCMDSSYVGCEIKKLENPELYEDFNFKKQVLEIIANNTMDSKRQISDSVKRGNED